jgi:hypothetical protein
MMLTFKAPSKSFLLGEYLATQGGLAQVAVFEPCFELKVLSCDQLDSFHEDSRFQDLKTSYIAAEKLFHPASPAGKWILENTEFFQNYRFQFLDPHQGRGGFGASTAQYLLIRQFQNSMKSGTVDIPRSSPQVVSLPQESLPQESLNKEQLHRIWEDYRRLAWLGKGAIPSGADLVAQASEEICFFRGENFFLQSFAWPFQDLALSFFATGIKLATHEHLGSLQTLNVELLKSISEKSYQAFLEKNSEAWIQSIRDYREALFQQGLEAQTTSALFGKLPTSVLAAKGCGAMGVDILMIVAKVADQESVREHIENLGLRWIQDSRNLYKATSGRI